jgi:hypothetical protein
MDDVRDRLDTLMRRIDQLVRRLAKLEEELDEIYGSLAEIWDAMRDDVAGQLPVRGTVRQRDDESRRVAARGVTSVEMDFGPDSGADVVIDGDIRLHLSPALAELLAILVLDPGGSDDGFVPFKSRRHVLQLLSKELGREVTPRALDQNLSRLRKKLSMAGGSRLWVASERRRGVRFALRRRPPGDGDETGPPGGSPA